MTPRHLILFLKVPRLGRAKTRLARDIGKTAAWAFSLHAARRAVRVFAADPRWRTWVALAPDGSATDPAVRAILRIPEHVSVLPQGAGNLGERMQRAFDALPPGPAVLIGTDIPDAVPGHVAAAFQALRNNDAAFGPAADGGYWLVGLKRGTRTPRLFRDVRWSGPHALADTLASMPPGTRGAVVDTLEDIDDGVSYRRWRKRRAPGPFPAVRR